MNSEKQKGVALVLVLLCLALLASAGSYLIGDDHMAIRRVENQHDRLQAQYLAESGLQWAMLVLQKDGESSNTDHLNESWNALVPPINIENGIWMAGFKRLLEITGQSPALAVSIKDWLDDDASPTGPEGAEDDEYLLGDPPMRTANSFMSDISELLLVKGIDRVAFEEISPLVSALPEAGLPININTCSDSLFGIFGRTVLPIGAGSALASGRGENGYPSIDDFITATELASHGDVAAGFADVSTTYFLVNVTSSYGRITISSRYLLKRSIEDNVYIDIVRVTSIS
ncbi:MAG: hypothetical protein GKR96_04895 [Gammaproteobacteria bacterium]|nr:hypothetical protein [Gammaproteobacteria bacterium]